VSEKTGRLIDGLEDVDLNGITPGDFRAAVAAIGLRVRIIRQNAKDAQILRAMRVARPDLGLEKLSTAANYAIPYRP
jgi:hypothetical protein